MNYCVKTYIYEGGIIIKTKLSLRLAQITTSITFLFFFLMKIYTALGLLLVCLPMNNKLLASMWSTSKYD